MAMPGSARARSCGVLSRTAFLAVLVASCDRAAPVEPEETPWRRYALTHVNGEVLPWWRGFSGTDSMWITAETLSLFPDGRARDAMHSAVGASSGTSTPAVLTLSTVFTLFADSIQVGTPMVCATLPCPSGVRRGSFGATELVLGDDALKVYRFVRVPTP